ncbi:Fc.00g088840.m01.CDS01 [Cosmosporella sp. VM-42]
MVRSGKAVDRDAGRAPRVRQLKSPNDDTTETTGLLGFTSPDIQDGNGVSASNRGWDGYDDFEGLSWRHRPSEAQVYWLFGPFAIFTLAFGGVIVPKLNLILDLVCRQYFADQKLVDPEISFNPILLGSDNPQCRIPEVQRNVAAFMLVMNLFTGILSAIVAPKLGHLSDRYGRTRLMALASCGGVLAECATILAAKYPEVINYRWLVLGSIFDGLTGSFTAGSILSQSYASDCTPPSKRAVSMGYMHACLFSGLAFGPLLAGYFVKWTGSLLSIFYVVLGCHIFFILVVGFVIPESLSQNKQIAAREKWEKEQEERLQTGGNWITTMQSANPFEPLKILCPRGPGTSPALRQNLIVLALNDMIILGSSMAAGAVIILYSEYTFDWGNFESSRFVSALSLVRVVVLMAIFPVINYYGRVRPAARRRRESGIDPGEKNSGADTLDIWVLRVALASDVLGGIGYTLARSEGLFFASGMVTAMGGLGSATIQAVVTKHVPSNRVGQILGAIGMLHALARVLGPLLFNSLYAATVATFPQAIFVALASLYGIGFIASWFIRPHIHWEDQPAEETEPLYPEQQAFNAIDEDQVRIQ